MDPFVIFPNELIRKIFGYIPEAKNLFSILQVSRRWHHFGISYIERIDFSKPRRIHVSKIIKLPYLREIGPNINVLIQDYDEAQLLTRLPFLFRVSIHINTYSSCTQFYIMILHILSGLKISEKLSHLNIRIMGTGHNVVTTFLLQGNRFMFLECGSPDLLNPPGYWDSGKWVQKIFRVDPRLISCTQNRYVHYYIQEIDRIPGLNRKFSLEDFAPRLLRPRMKVFLRRVDLSLDLTGLIEGGICGFHSLRKIFALYLSKHGLLKDKMVQLDTNLQYLFPKYQTLPLTHFNKLIAKVGLFPAYPSLDNINEYEVPAKPLNLDLYKKVSEDIDRAFSS